MHSDPTPPCGPGGIDGGGDGVSRNDWAAEGWYCEHGKYDPERACTNGWNQDHVTRPITGVEDGAIRGGDGVELGARAGGHIEPGGLWDCSDCPATGFGGALALYRHRVAARHWGEVPVIRPSDIPSLIGYTRRPGCDFGPGDCPPDDYDYSAISNPPPATDHDNDPPAGPGERWPVSERIEPLGHSPVDTRKSLRGVRKLARRWFGLLRRTWDIAGQLGRLRGTAGLRTGVGRESNGADRGSDSDTAGPAGSGRALRRVVKGVGE